MLVVFGSSEVIEVVVLDIGFDDEVDVIDVLVLVGDIIEKEDGLIIFEIDKVIMDVFLIYVGMVKEVFISIGDKVKEGMVVIKFEVVGLGLFLSELVFSDVFFEVFVLVV